MECFIKFVENRGITALLFPLIKLHLESLMYDLFKFSQPKMLSTEKIFIFNFRFTNGVPLWSKVVYKRVGVWASGRSIPVRIFVGTWGGGAGGMAR